MADNRVKFAECSSLYGVLCAHVLQTLEREDPSLHKEALRRYNKDTDTLRFFGTNLGHRLDVFFQQKEQRGASEKLQRDSEARDWKKSFEQQQAAELDQAIKTREREVAAEKRWQEYVDVGLLDSPENRKQISDWLVNGAAKGFVSAANLDAAIKVLGNKLDWRKTGLLPALKPKEVLGTCSDGLPQLPINTVPNYSHSVAQLHDLLKRQSQ